MLTFALVSQIVGVEHGTLAANSKPDGNTDDQIIDTVSRIQVGSLQPAAEHGEAADTQIVPFTGPFCGASTIALPMMRRRRDGEIQRVRTSSEAAGALNKAVVIVIDEEQGVGGIAVGEVEESGIRHPR